MRFPFLIFAILFSAVGFSAFPKEPFPVSESPVTLTKEELANMKTVSCNDFESNAHALIGKVVKLKFSYRDKDITESRYYEDAFVGELQFYVDSSRKRTSDSGWGFVDVLLPKHAMPWFTRIPTNIDARGTLIVVARVTKDASNQSPFLILMGSKISSDSKGTHVSW